MQQLVILLLINCSSTCFGHLYAHHQEVRLCFTAYGFLSCCSCCDVESRVASCVHMQSHSRTVKQPTPHCAHSLPPDSQHHNSYNRTENHRQWNTVWPADDGRKDAWNMLRNNWVPIKSLIVASSWSRLYLLIKDARSFEHKVSWGISCRIFGRQKWHWEQFLCKLFS